MAVAFEVEWPGDVSVNSSNALRKSIVPAHESTGANVEAAQHLGSTALCLHVRCTTLTLMEATGKCPVSLSCAAYRSPLVSCRCVEDYGLV